MKNNMYICSAKPLASAFIALLTTYYLTLWALFLLVGVVNAMLTISQKQGGNALLFSVAKTLN